METKLVHPSEMDNGDVLVGDNQGLSLITGDVSRSSIMHGCYAVETEHGTLYLDEDLEYMVQV
jgi:hypothetical protein